jgi:hypothetical protein
MTYNVIFLSERYENGRAFVKKKVNTGGTLLQPQEIRACIYHGPFAELLDELNSNPDWRKIYGAPSKRLKDQELILRFLAFSKRLSITKIAKLTITAKRKAK